MIQTLAFQLSCNSCSRLTKTLELRKLSSTLMQLLFSFDQDVRVEKTLIQTLACQLSSTLMQLLFSFDQDMRVEKTLIQTLACQLSSTLMQLLFSFYWGRQGTDKLRKHPTLFLLKQYNLPDGIYIQSPGLSEAYVHWTLAMSGYFIKSTESGSMDEKPDPLNCFYGT